MTDESSVRAPLQAAGYGPPGGAAAGRLRTAARGAGGGSVLPAAVDRPATVSPRYGQPPAGTDRLRGTGRRPVATARRPEASDRKARWRPWARGSTRSRSRPWSSASCRSRPAVVGSSARRSRSGVSSSASWGCRRSARIPKRGGWGHGHRGDRHGERRDSPRARGALHDVRRRAPQSLYGLVIATRETRLASDEL